MATAGCLPSLLAFAEHGSGRKPVGQSSCINFSNLIICCANYVGHELLMPITKGSGNPDWTRDECLLALDLLYRHGGPVGKNNRDVLELSKALRAAEIYPSSGRKENFRNPVRFAQ